MTDGTVSAIIGPQNIKAFEQSIKQHTGVDVNEPITEEFMDGADYDYNGNLRDGKMEDLLIIPLTWD